MFSDYLFEKLAKTFGASIVQSIYDLLPFYSELSEHLSDFTLLIDDIDYETLSSKLIIFANALA